MYYLQTSLVTLHQDTWHMYCQDAWQCIEGTPSWHTSVMHYLQCGHVSCVERCLLCREMSTLRLMHDMCRYVKIHICHDTHVSCTGNACEMSTRWYRDVKVHICHVLAAVRTSLMHYLISSADIFYVLPCRHLICILTFLTHYTLNMSYVLPCRHLSCITTAAST